MPYPPHIRKHPELSAAEARAIGTGAMAPYRWKPGESGNPAGFSKSRREQIAACEAAALERTPEALATLTELMRHSPDDRVRTRCAEIIIERGLGKPREAPPPEAVEEILHKGVNVSISFVAARTAPPSPAPAGPIIDAAPEPQPGDAARVEARGMVSASSEAVSTEARIEQLERAIAQVQEQLEEARATAVRDDNGHAGQCRS